MRKSSIGTAAFGFFVTICCTVAPTIAATSDSEGNLRLPHHKDSSVELILQSGPVEDVPSANLQVFVGVKGGCCTGKSPMAGSYSLKGRLLTFKPAFDFVETQTYTVLTRYKDVDAQSGLARSVDQLTEFKLQEGNLAESPEVIAIYPSGDIIPENTLRFYIHFSSAMKPHMANQFIKLVDETGAVDDAAFMSFKQELWSEDRKRLTLLMDPGRIKRGVTQNMDLGPALIEGSRYSIVIEAGWQNATGTETAPRFEKPFNVSQSLRARPDTQPWRVKPVRALTHDPLLIDFDRPFDHQLVQNSIAVLDQQGRRIPGKVSIESSEQAWRFDPLIVWADEPFRLVVDARLEDVAGNNFRELLDRELDEEVRADFPDTIVLEYVPVAG